MVRAAVAAAAAASAAAFKGAAVTSATSAFQLSCLFIPLFGLLSFCSDHFEQSVDGLLFLTVVFCSVDTPWRQRRAAACCSSWTERLAGGWRHVGASWFQTKLKLQLKTLVLCAPFLHYKLTYIVHNLKHCCRILCFIKSSIWVILLKSTTHL